MKLSTKLILIYSWTKNKTYTVNTKSDIYIYEEETDFKLHIEVDESNHFYPTNISCKKDREIINNFNYLSDIKILRIENNNVPTFTTVNNNGFNTILL